MNETGPAKWPLSARIGFRFLFSYLVLFFFPFPQGLVNPYWLGGFFAPFWRKLMPWFADRFFNLDVTIPNNGSGDTTYHYIRIFLMAVISVLAAGIWSALDRRRGDYRALYSWSRIWLRYALGLCMLTFGVVKVVMLQFESPGSGRLMQPVGELSPMVFLWTFMGFSPLYTSFTGVTEVIGGMLLLFRRTATLGALVVAGIMTNVVMLNMSFDVPVKLGALHLFLLALVLAAPDAVRLLNFFVLNRLAPPADLGPHWHGWTLVFSRWAKALVIGAGLIYFVWDAHRAYERQSAAREAPPVAPEGSYQVVSIRRDGKEVQAANPDELRWKRVTLRRGVFGLRGLDGSLHRFKADGDPLKGPAALLAMDDKGEPVKGAPPIGALRLTPIGDGTTASLTGMFNEHRVDALLKRQNAADFTLMSRGFRWISEEPYFR